MGFIASLSRPLVGPPASAKTMILEAIFKYYDVPIILAGASTRAGLRDYIVENVPEIMLIDELDKVENTLDLSVLLTWMESQKLIVTMATKKAYVKCPKVCKVIAAANQISRIPPELLSRFVVVNLKPYTEDEVREICINILKNREGVDEGLAKKVAEAIVSKLKSKDPRDCVKIARLARTPEEVDKVVEILSKRK
jgi:Holliday junction DNA helicase RuvB